MVRMNESPQTIQNCGILKSSSIRLKCQGVERASGTAAGFFSFRKTSQQIPMIASKINEGKPITTRQLSPLKNAICPASSTAQTPPKTKLSERNAMASARCRDGNQSGTSLTMLSQPPAPKNRFAM